MRQIIYVLAIFYFLTSTAASAQESDQTHSWDFNEPVLGVSAGGWEAVNYDNPNTQEGILSLTTTSGYPSLIFHSKDGDINAAVSKQIVIRLKNGTSSRRARFYWEKDGEAFRYDFLVTTHDEDFREYLIDLTHDTRWSGMIETMRFQIPMPVPSGSVGNIINIDYIRLLKADSDIIPMPSKTPAPFGVNLAGGDFAPGTPNYQYPHAEELDYFLSKGLTLIRLPFKWERIQPDLNGSLDPKDLNEIRNFVWAARKRGIWVLFDMHNYGRRRVDGVNTVIGNPGVTIEDSGEVWRRIADEFKGFENIYAYGLMNEPYGMGSPDRWFHIAQGMIDAIRSTDTVNAIMVGGESYSSAARWQSVSDNLRNLVDPADNLIFEAHVYFDNDASGSYQRSYDLEGTTENTGIERLKPFVDWLALHNKRGFIGEYGVPDSDERWNIVLDRTLNYMKENYLNGTYWAAGSRWGNHHMAVHPYNDLSDRPQMKVLERYHYADGESTSPLPPLITSTSIARYNIANEVNYQITGTGNPVSYHANGLPLGLQVDEVTGIISGTIGEGDFPIEISASNQTGTGNSRVINLIGMHLRAPGIIEAEHFNDGGQNVGYFDTSSGNMNPNVDFRNESVDIAHFEDDNYIINFTADGEWLKYTVDIQEEGAYIIKIRYRTTLGTPVINFSIDGKNLSGDVVISPSDEWNLVLAEIPVLSKGFHEVVLNIVKGGGNYDFFDFQLVNVLDEAPQSFTAKRSDSETVSLEWEALSGAGSYILKRSEEKNGEYETVADNIATTQYIDENLKPYITYYYQVFGFNITGPGPGSEIITVTDPTDPILSIDDRERLDQGIKIYPNPSYNGMFYLEAYHFDNVPISLVTYNSHGKVVHSLENIEVETFRKGVDLNGLGKGVYFMKVNIGTVSFTRTILIQ